MCFKDFVLERRVRGAVPVLRSGLLLALSKPSPLLEGCEESCIQNVFLRLPSAVPLSQRGGGRGVRYHTVI